ncbi:hypothetical protein KR009_007134 [Drosophila setifemur]|nr:hypothetical protein KR009_007134 [Drosophila setifemur]
MRVLIVFALVTLLAMSFVAAQPSEGSGESENNNSTSSGDGPEGSDDPPVINPRPRWPKWGGIGPVIFRTTPIE